MSHLTRKLAVTTATLACLVCGVLSSSALAATSKPRFRPTVGHAMGLVPPVGYKGTEPSEGGIYAPVTYRGGPTMSSGVTVHTIFWAPSGYAFQGSPGGTPPAPTYTGMIEQFFGDAAAASTGTAAGPGCSLADCNPFTVEAQYGWGTTPGGITSGNNTITYNSTETTFPSGYTSADDAIIDTNPYPANGCTSPEDDKACLTDQQIQDEVDNVIQHTSGTPRGLNNLWIVYTPPNVDECIISTLCETTAFGGYHSLSNEGHGLTIYAFIGDPLVETSRVYTAPHPQGNPDAEVTADISLHETNEAMSDPTGVGYIDAQAYEIGDKCEFGQPVQPLGYVGGTGPGAGQPYDAVINGDKYYLQSLWSQADGGCVGASAKTIADNPLPLPQVNLTQYGSTINGNTETATAGVHVTVQLIRALPNGASAVVAQAGGVTDANGAWKVRLPGGRAVGDDRDEIDVIYSGAGAPTPHHQVILTGNGGDPYAESGWSGWTAMDQGNVLTNNDQAPWRTPQTAGGPSLTMDPCFQTGVLGFTINGSFHGSPTHFCSTSFDTADTPLSSPVSRGDVVRTSSTDNRAFQPGVNPFPNAAGALVKLTVPVGEPDSVLFDPGSGSPVFNPLGIIPSGPPICEADLAAQAATCGGLVPGDHYMVRDGSQAKSTTADGTGSVNVPLKIARGDQIVLSNGSRTLTVLHVARLRVHINGNGGTVASGVCSPGEYWGGPLTTPPLGAFGGAITSIGGGSALTGEICPKDGNAAGLPTDTLAQTDERSGGFTQTEVAQLTNTSPLNGETMYGHFTALAETSSANSPVTLVIKPSGGGKAVIYRANVNTPGGSSVGGLKPGAYKATWIVTNANGDTRTVTTRFIEQAGTQGPRGKQGPPGKSPDVKCHQVNQHHRKSIQCNVAFQHGAQVHGLVRMRITRGSNVAALGHGQLHNGSTTVTMRELRSLSSGTWRITLVYSSGRSTRTLSMRVLVV